MTTPIDYWALSQKGFLCDATAVEITASGQKSTYTVHRLFLLQCPYFKTLLENPLGGKESAVYTVVTESQDEPGHLAVVLQALYRGVDEYDNLLRKKDSQYVMIICMLCDYLGLDSHVDNILFFIKKSRSNLMNKIAEWWSARHQRGLEVPDKIDTHIQNYLRGQIRYHKSGPYISVHALRSILPDDDNSIHIRDFLSSTFDCLPVDDLKPNRLKRLSTYLVYCRENLKAIKRENPDADGKEIMEILMHNWKKLSNTEKARWNTRADEVNAEREAKNIESGFEPFHTLGAIRRKAAEEEAEEEEADEDENK